MMDADVVVYASPMFCWSWTAQIKPLIDRHFCLVTDLGNGVYKSLAEGKKVALVGTCAGPMEANGNLLVEQFSALVDYAKARLVGQLFVPLCTTPEAMSPLFSCRTVKSPAVNPAAAVAPTVSVVAAVAAFAVSVSVPGGSVSVPPPVAGA